MPPAVQSPEPPHRAFWLAAGLWLSLLGGALLLRPLLPVDETRYAAVAWEMWQRGDFLVPYLNGAAYSHKPPLMFWLIHLGWAVSGVNEWWPRAVPALAELGAILLTVRLARLLWPALPQAAGTAALVLAASGLWAALDGALFFDPLLAAAVVLALNGLAESALHPASRRGLWLTAAGLAAGALAKGPVVLLHVLPVALLAPWWAPARGLPRGRWYGRLALAVLLGAGLALAWALPAAWRGGDEYRAAILWGQTAGRMVESVAHARPWWWYLPLLPAVLFPWVLWPALLRRLVRLAGEPRDWGVRLCIAWALPTLLAFCAISGKQAHYLLPMLPAFALLAARALQLPEGDAPRSGVLLPALLLAALGGVILAAPLLHPPRGTPWLPMLPAWPGALLLLAAAALAASGRLGLRRQVAALAASSVAGLLLVQAAFMAAVRPAYDLRDFSVRLGVAQRQGRPLAYVGKYHGQFHFLGRLAQPVAEVEPQDARRWLSEHPRGVLVARGTDWRAETGEPAWSQPYRGDTLAAWTALPAERLAALE